VPLNPFPVSKFPDKDTRPASAGRPRSINVILKEVVVPLFVAMFPWYLIPCRTTGNVARGVGVAGKFSPLQPDTSTADSSKPDGVMTSSRLFMAAPVHGMTIGFCEIVSRR
jgi:hypothetical protein